MSSPFTKNKQAPVFPELAGFPPTMSKPSSPLTVLKPANQLSAFTVSISDNDVENIAADAGTKVALTTEKIVGQMVLNKFSDLGTMLATLQVEAGRLDPNNLPKSSGGILSWFKKKVNDVRVEMTSRLNTASQAFDKLETELVNHIAKHQVWITDLETLYNENFQNWNKLGELIVKAETWQSTLKDELQRLPKIAADDPDAMMKAQVIRDIESRLNRLGGKLDNLRRYRAVCENNAPKIRSQQDSSRAVIGTLRDVMEAFPTIKMEFALYMQSLEVTSSTSLVTGTRNLVRNSLTTASETAKSAAISTATNLNSAVIDNATIDKLRANMLDTITQVRQIENIAAAQRVTDAEHLKQGQAQFLTALQNSGGV
jgi:uncharacterized protein YaaN involved in tellurite resistance